MDFADALVDPEGGAPEVPLVPHQLQPLLRVKQLLFIATITTGLLAVTSYITGYHIRLTTFICTYLTTVAGGLKSWLHFILSTCTIDFRKGVLTNEVFWGIFSQHGTVERANFFEIAFLNHH